MKIARQAYAELLKHPATTTEERKALMMKKAKGCIKICYGQTR